MKDQETESKRKESQKYIITKKTKGRRTEEYKKKHDIKKGKHQKNIDRQINNKKGERRKQKKTQESQKAPRQNGNTNRL